MSQPAIAATVRAVKAGKFIPRRAAIVLVRKRLRNRPTCRGSRCELTCSVVARPRQPWIRSNPS